MFFSSKIRVKGQLEEMPDKHGYTYTPRADPPGLCPRVRGYARRYGGVMPAGTGFSHRRTFSVRFSFYENILTRFSRLRFSCVIGLLMPISTVFRICRKKIALNFQYLGLCFQYLHLICNPFLKKFVSCHTYHVPVIPRSLIPSYPYAVSKSNTGP